MNESTESKLKNCETEAEKLIKQSEEKIKLYSKLETKSKTKDKDVLKAEIEDAINNLDDLVDRSSELLSKINELKKEDESPNLKEKDFKKRKENEAKKVKENQSKLEKCLKKLNNDLEHLQKDEAPSALKNLVQVFKPKRDKSSDKKSANEAESKSKKKSSKQDKEEVKTHEQDDDEDEDDGEEDHDEEDDEHDEHNDDAERTNQEPKGLKDLLAEEKRQLLINNKKNKLEKKQPSEEKLQASAGSEKDKKFGLKELLREEKQNIIKSDRPKTSKETESDDENEPPKEETRKNSNAPKDKGKVLGLKELISLEREEVKARQMSKNEISEDENDDTAIAKAYEKSIEDQSGKKDPNDHVIKRESTPILNKPPTVHKTKIGEDSEDESEISDEESENDDEHEAEMFQDEIKETRPISKQTHDDTDDLEEGTEFHVIDDYIGEQDDDLDIKIGEIVEYVGLCDDPEYIEVKNQFGQAGLVPKNKLKIAKKTRHEPANEPDLKEVESEQQPKANLWSKAKDNLKKKGIIDSEALIVGGFVPASFSESMLGKFNQNTKYTFEEYLKPKLTQSGLNFKNFYWDIKNNRILNKQVSFQKVFTIHKCTNIPLPNKNELEILTRSVRICLFDGVSILSNIHTIRAHVIGKEEKTWVFEDDYSDVVQIIDFSEFFVRTNITTNRPNLGILFELSITCQKKNTNEEVELGCGWAHIPFIESSRFQITNKSYDLILNGGSVFDKNVPLDPNLARNTGTLGEIITKIFKESKIKFNVKDPNNAMLESLNVLPFPMIASTLVAPYMKYYYEELGLNVLVPMFELGSFDASTEPINSEFLRTFPRSLTETDILNALRINFNLFREHLSREERNDSKKQRELFIKQYKELCYPLFYHNSLPKFKISDHASLQERQIIIGKISKEIRKEKSMAFLLNDEYKFEPISTDEFCFEII